MSRKKVIISAIVAAMVVMAGGGGVYAAYNYHQEQIEQERVEEEREKERLKQEEEKRLKEQEEKRLEDARAEIARELESLDAQVVALYSDNQKKMLVDGIDQDAIDSVLEKIESFKEVYKENKDISQEQNGKLQELEEDVKMANTMNKVVTKYNSLYPNGQLTVPKIETDEIVTTIKEVLKELELVKPDFFRIYSEKLSETESNLVYQKSVVDAVNMIYNRETGNMVEGVTRQQYTDVLAAVESLSENAMKAELKQYLIVVDQVLTAQEVAKAKTETSGSSVSGKRSNNSNNAGTSSNGNSNSSSENKSSGSSKKSSGSSSSGGSSGSGSKGSSEGGSGSSGNVSSSGNNSSGDSSGGSSGGSLPSGSGGNSSSGGNDSDGNGSWEGTVQGGGNTVGGGTYEWGTW